MQLTPGEEAVPERRAEVDTVTSPLIFIFKNTKSCSFFSSVPYIFKDMFPLTDFIWGLKCEKVIFNVASTFGGF